MYQKPIDDKTKERFWENVNKCRPDECWEWTASKTRGYGQLNRGKNLTPYKAHRLSWVIHNGPILNGLHVLHNCHNPACVNPNHLRLGTHQDNMRDREEAGRNNPGHVPGDKNGQAIISWGDAKRIRYLHDTQNQPPNELAKIFPIGRDQILKILKNESWYDASYCPRYDLIEQRKYKPPAACGEDHPGSKLTESQVKAIRSRYSQGDISHKQLSKIYGVKKQTITSVLNYKTWRHV